ncbi:hypothetical protein DRP07_00685 [Archaeoglobales archaeon]|nr:MAG: hypothetical protein DRP07_00685 [Archaeoglobales archaeon]
MLIIDVIIAATLILFISAFLMNMPLLLITSATLGCGLLILTRMLAPTGFKILWANLTRKMFLDVRSETKRMNLLDCDFESGFAVVEDGVKIPVDYESVYYLDGVPVQTVWRSVGKGLRIDVMAFFKWLEDYYGIDVDTFEKVMDLAVERNITFRNMEEFLAFCSELIEGTEEKVEQIKEVDEVEVKKE